MLGVKLSNVTEPVGPNFTEVRNFLLIRVVSFHVTD